MTFGRKMMRGLKAALSLLSPAAWKAVLTGVSTSGKTVTAQNALTLSTVWACVRLVAGTISSLPVMVYQEDAKGVRRVAKAHPLYALLHDSPNADQSALDFWQFMCVSLELWGDAFARITRGRGGKIVALTPLRPEAVQVRRVPDGSIRYRYVEGGKTHDVGQDEMFHVRGFGGSPLGGLSTLSFGRHSFGLALATDEAAAQVYRNGLRPTGVLTTKDNQTLKKEQRDDIYKYVVEPLAGDNSGKPLVLEAGLGWQSLSIAPGDAQVIESRQFSVEDGCRWFGVPPHLVGHTAGNTNLGSSIEQQTLGWLMFGLRERLKRIEQAVMKQLLTAAERMSITVEFSIEGLLRADSAARASFYSAMVQNGIMTRNEVRGLENLPPLDGGDELTVQSNMIPVSKLGELTSTSGEAARRSIIDWLFPEGMPSLKQKEDA
ncbi:phage portal protein [Sphingomonas koreensis]|uniref:phage portal protein n=1 Tax=Sphingomonas koreensis TaxID=93064 RepID=UPI000F7EFD97|nr:phage portal protein [Sphingomonas koreensis]RSU21212.1 phage portal protein [Sphingomonas koreensis]RSU32223.1 phage portal protein [Sphingomonas koreensis]RSU35717.1 phage portal protein [Sphingomonas koreensis]RSU49888.1 phage portal protein [Sphingomonas koreensis]RSU83485.1 phage portal protein [Sphingomonas koreensis]